MAFAKVNNINFHYEIRGTGPRVLFINGFGADLKNPPRIFDTPLPQQFTVLAFDPRGLGESDSPTIPCTIADMADDAAGLASAVGWDRYHVFGASMGGMVAQELILRHPVVVQKLILGVTNAGGKNAGPVLVDKLDKMSTLEQLRLSDTRQDEAWAAAHPEMVRQFKARFLAVREAWQDNPAHIRGYNNQINAVLKHNSYDRLPQITASTLVFGGRYDGCCPPEIIRALADQIPGARYELLEAGHGSWFVDPTVWEMITNFLLD
ncbi:alpha/beta fold hydrolase [Desulfoscipio gibsoniae]|uniref:Putative hydrolase or acyltransferase of alpha/beta superfamily n=1 Tax=Desulfoscipio gibsoniae DSM 7213 TaxID=767817 RepID=R4KFX6_9FIRM|nr:alpha/beta fold hydrolase [Desulfoscipio gibsoniae]AGL00552.1 putative hydrolase or acyltransferase of alpha/beta superfamily [Desulfoscipio gibsoniae DSM 7213]